MTNHNFYSKMPKPIVRGGRMIKWKGHVASTVPSVFLATASVIALTTAMATADTVSTAVTFPVVLGTDIDHTITNTGSVSTTSSPAQAVVFINVADFTANAQNQGTISAVDPATTLAVGFALGGDLSGSLANTGTISTNVSTTTTDANIAGVGIVGDVNAGGTVTNGGSIEVDVLATSADVVGVGVLVGGDLSGALANTGTVRIASDVSSGSAQAIGLSVNGGLTGGSISNTGTLDAGASGGTSGLAIGISVGAGAGTGEITNSGTIVAVGAGSTALGFAAGVLVDGDLSGTIRNSGEIATLGLSAGTGAVGVGIALNGNATGATIETDGTIEVSAINFGFVAPAAAVAIQANDLTAGTEIIANGTLSAVAASPLGNAVARGVRTTDVSDSSIESVGTIDAAATGLIADAYGIDTGDLTNGSSILNGGDISAAATGILGAAASGVAAEAVTDSTITNGGTVTINADATSGAATANGVLVDGNLTTGAVVNDGSILVEAQSDTTTAQAFGVQTDTLNDASISNDGTIDATAISTDGEASVEGISTATLNSSSVTTLGGITVSAQSTTKNAEADGISTASINSSVITNGGPIDAQAEGTDAEAYGMNTISMNDATIVNDGVITVMADGDIVDGVAYGIETANMNNGSSIVNNGDIVAEAIGERDGTAYGIEGANVTGSSVINNGSIAVNSVSDTRAVRAFAIQFEDLDDATFENNGSISADASSTQSATLEVNAISLGDVTNGSSITNSGTIAAGSNGGPSGSASAVGVYASLLDGTSTVSNTGVITSDAVGQFGSAAAAGIAIDQTDAGAEINNSGAITVTAENTGGSEIVAGIFVDVHNGTVNNTGDITTDAADGNYAIWLMDGTGDLNMDTSGRIDGVMGVNAHDVTLTSSGGNVVWEFIDTNSALGTFNLVVDGGPDWFILNGGTNNPIYFTYDPGAFVGEQQVLGAITNETRYLNTHLTEVLEDADGGGARLQFSEGMAFGAGAWAEGNTAFVRSTATESTYGAVGGTGARNSSVSTVSFGTASILDSGLGLGFIGGYTTATTSSRSDSSEATGFYAGAAIGKTLSGTQVTFGVDVGRMSHDSTRNVNLSEKAIASYDSTWANLKVKASRKIDMGNGLTITPNAALMYTTQSAGGYTETGSSANSTVGKRSNGVMQGDLGLDFEKSNGTNTFSGHLGYQVRSFSGDAATDVTIFGQTNSIASSAQDYNGVVIGVGYNYAINEASQFDVSVKHSIGSDNTNHTSISAKLDFKF